MRVNKTLRGHILSIAIAIAVIAAVSIGVANALTIDPGAELEVELGPPDAFELDAVITLDPMTDLDLTLPVDFTLTVGALTTTVSLTPDEEGVLGFEGIVDVDGVDVDLDVEMTPLGDGIFELDVEGEGADLGLMGDELEVNVELTIDGDTGSAAVPVEFED